MVEDEINEYMERCQVEGRVASDDVLELAMLAEEIKAEANFYKIQPNGN